MRWCQRSHCCAAYSFYTESPAESAAAESAASPHRHKEAAVEQRRLQPAFSVSYTIVYDPDVVAISVDEIAAARHEASSMHWPSTASPLARPFIVDHAMERWTALTEWPHGNQWLERLVAEE